MDHPFLKGLKGTPAGHKLFACAVAAIFAALPFFASVVMAGAGLVIGPVALIVALFIGLPLAMGVEERDGLTLQNCVVGGLLIGTVPLTLLLSLAGLSEFLAQHEGKGLAGLIWAAVLGLRSIVAFALAGGMGGLGFWLTLRILHDRPATA